MGEINDWEGVSRDAARHPSGAVCVKVVEERLVRRYRHSGQNPAFFGFS